MKKFKFLTVIFLVIFNLSATGQDFFPRENLMDIGVYYYPEHWEPSQWDRDIKNIAAHGFKFIHLAEFSWVFLEPSEGVYDFSWLDRVIELAGANGLKVILCTPTPCPPVWMGIKYPEIYLMDAQYQRKEHGTRANMSLTNANAIRLSKKIVTEMGKRYGKHKTVIGWQLDNEPEAKEDYSPSSQKAFQTWLKNKYTSIDKLNNAWGTRFWGQLYADFRQIKIPNATLVGWWGCNPSALLDFKRFSADIQAKFLDMQAVELRKHIGKEQFITTNYVAKGTQADPGLTKRLDFNSFTAYPNYGSENLGEIGFRMGDPDLIIFAADFFKSKNKYSGVMELQPGQVNWGGYNPLLYPGAVRMWLWHCFGGGLDFACTYRYRQITYGAEQFHAGITTSDGVSLSPGGKEFVEVIKEMNLLRKEYQTDKKMPEEISKRRTAILWSLDNFWNLERQKQNYRWDTWQHLHKYHRILKSLGAPVEFISEEDDFSPYPFMVVPAYLMVDESLVQKWEKYVEQGGNLLITCRTGSKDKNAQLWEGNVSAIMNKLIGGKIQSFDMLPPSKTGNLTMNNRQYPWNTWGELIEPLENTKILAIYADQFYQGTACCLQNRMGKGQVLYIGVDTQDGCLEKEIIQQMFSESGVPTENYPEGVLVYWRDGFCVAVNYSSVAYQLNTTPNVKFFLGNSHLKPGGVSVWLNPE